MKDFWPEIALAGVWAAWLAVSMVALIVMVSR